LHPQKFGCTPKNEGKGVHVPPDEKTCGHAAKLSRIFQLDDYLIIEMNECQFPVYLHFLISVNMNLLSSSIYKHLKTYLIKHKQSLILGECGSQLISVLSNIFQF
jgi:hypothetical protein